MSFLNTTDLPCTSIDGSVNSRQAITSSNDQVSSPSALQPHTLHAPTVRSCWQFKAIVIANDDMALVRYLSIMVHSCYSTAIEPPRSWTKTIGIPSERNWNRSKRTIANTPHIRLNLRKCSTNLFASGEHRTCSMRLAYETRKCDKCFMRKWWLGDGLNIWKIRGKTPVKFRVEPGRRRRVTSIV